MSDFLGTSSRPTESAGEEGGGDDRPLTELASEICAVAARIAAATGSWLDLIAAFDRREGWAGPGMKSCAHWLAWKCHLAPGTAREHVRVARALPGLPLVANALRTGRLSYSVVRELTRIADPDNESDLLQVALSCTAGQVQRIVRGWRRADQASDPEPESRRLGLHVHWDDDGSLRIAGRLNAEDGALFLTALTAATERLESQRPDGVSTGANGGAGRSTVRSPRNGATRGVPVHPEPEHPPVDRLPEANGAEDAIPLARAGDRNSVRSVTSGTRKWTATATPTATRGRRSGFGGSAVAPRR